MQVLRVLALCAVPLSAFAALDSTKPVLGGNWQEQNDGKGSTAKLRAVAEVNGSLVAVGDAGAYLTSTDKGVTWTSQAKLNIDGEEVHPTNAFYDLQVSNGRLIMVGAPKIILISDDNGATWTNTLPTTIKGSFGLRGLSVVDGDLITVGSGGAVLESFDNGDTWEQIHPGNTKGYLAVASGDSIVVAVGTGGAIMTRGATAAVDTGDDTTTTTDTTTTDPDAWVIQTSGTTNNLWGVTYTGSTFVAVGEKGTIITSTDGVNWTDHSQAMVNGTYPFFTDVISVGSVLMTSGVGWLGSCYSSDEGATWKYATVTAYGTAKIAGGSMQDLAVTTDGVVSVGLNAETWYSDGSFELWIQNAGYTGTSATETADPDGDGITNLTEYVLGMDPTAAPTDEQRALLPRGSAVAGGATYAFTLPTTLPAGVTATLEKSTKLGTTATWTTYATIKKGVWTLSSTTDGSTIATATADGLSVTTLKFTTGSGFYRLKFSR